MFTRTVFVTKPWQQAIQLNRQYHDRYNRDSLANDTFNIVWPVKVKTTPLLETTIMLAQMLYWSVKCLVKRVRGVSKQTGFIQFQLNSEVLRTYECVYTIGLPHVMWYYG